MPIFYEKAMPPLNNFNKPGLINFVIIKGFSEFKPYLGEIKHGN